MSQQPVARGRARGRARTVDASQQAAPGQGPRGPGGPGGPGPRQGPGPRHGGPRPVQAVRYQFLKTN